MSWRKHALPFIEKLKMTRDLVYIPLVVCTTSRRTIEEKQSWLVSKGALVVRKPFDIAELLKAIQHQLADGNAPGRLL